MLSSANPVRFPQPFAATGQTNVIPSPSQRGIVLGAASLADGFPPETMLPTTSGGANPDGKDFNGILKQITQWVIWQIAGGPMTFDTTFAAAIGGYPKFAVLVSKTVVGKYFINNVDNNSVDPENTGGGNGNWLVITLPVDASPIASQAWVIAQITAQLSGYLTAASLAGYATQSWVSQQLTSYATVSWVNSQLVPYATQAYVQGNFLAKGVNGPIDVSGNGIYQRQVFYNPVSNAVMVNSITFNCSAYGVLLIVAATNTSGPQPVACGSHVILDGTEVTGDIMSAGMVNPYMCQVLSGNHTIIHSYTIPTFGGTFNNVALNTAALFVQR